MTRCPRSFSNFAASRFNLDPRRVLLLVEVEESSTAAPQPLIDFLFQCTHRSQLSDWLASPAMMTTL
jgi:hypothetical protein